MKHENEGTKLSNQKLIGKQSFSLCCLNKKFFSLKFVRAKNERQEKINFPLNTEKREQKRIENVN